MKNEQRDARLLQGLSGAPYSTCLGWVRTLRDEGALPRWSGEAGRRAELRAAVAVRWPSVTWL